MNETNRTRKGETMTETTITDQAILDRLCTIRGVTVEWTGGMPRDAEQWDGKANEILPTLTVANVRWQLDGNKPQGDDEAETIDMAISMACEPLEMPEGGCVVLIRD